MINAMSERSLGLVVGLAIGTATAALFNQLGHAADWSSPAKYLEAEGLLWGTLAAVPGYGLVRLLFVSWRVRAAVLGMTILLGAMGLVTLWWMFAVGVPPLLSLEGAWLWPLAIVPLILSSLTFRHWRRLGDRSSQSV